MLCAATRIHAFLIDIDTVAFDDIKADDLGSWKATDNKKVFFM